LCFTVFLYSVHARTFNNQHLPRYLYEPYSSSMAPPTSPVIAEEKPAITGVDEQEYAKAMLNNALNRATSEEAAILFLRMDEWQTRWMPVKEMHNRYRAMEPAIVEIKNQYRMQGLPDVAIDQYVELFVKIPENETPEQQELRMKKMGEWTRIWSPVMEEHGQRHAQMRAEQIRMAGEVTQILSKTSAVALRIQSLCEEGLTTADMLQQVKVHVASLSDYERSVLNKVIKYVAKTHAEETGSRDESLSLMIQ
ncbi:hypothetical protein PMAYCL1PPCAC_08288, partial [Pristionchus mayeri]